jgi:hypothetical protein
MTRHDRGSALPIAVLLVGVTSLLLIGLSHMATTLMHRQHAQTAAEALALAVAQQRKTSDIVTIYDIEQYSVNSDDDVVSVHVVRRGVEAWATAVIHHRTSSYT